ncbi:MAG TPA: STAS domain-containing protein [Gammaproteobacteria bacterium]|nr:STAS domain-containing protein [Gammaproteobacteria bacterium]
MATETATDTDFFHIECADVLDISGVAEFHAHCLEALGTQKTLILNASQVDRADTAALQVLSAFIQNANAQQQTVQWESPSEALCQSAALLGLSEILCLPITAE